MYKEKTPDMSELDRTLHPDIHELTDIRDVVNRIIASCECQTKTPEPKYHAPHCRYKHLAYRLEELTIMGT
jgi:hypothetical protein